MKRISLILLACGLLSSMATAQGKAKIIIKKNIDGEETIIEKEYDLSDGADLSELLEDEDISLDFQFDQDPFASFFHFDMGEGAFPFGPGQMEDRAALGIVQTQASEEAGVTVSEVIAGSTAEAMGLLAGDRITRVNGSDIYDMDDLRRHIEAAQIGDEIKVEVDRDGKRKKFKGELLAAPQAKMGFFGMPGTPFGQGEDFFEGGSLMDEEAMEEMMRMLQEQMEHMQLGFEMPDMQGGDMQHFYFGPDGLDAEGGMTSSLQFDVPSAAELEALPAEADLSTADDLPLQGLHFSPLMGSAFHLDFELADQDDLSVSIYDAQGKMVYYEMLGEFSGSYANEIDLSGREAGVYYLEIAQGTKSFCRKVIKN